jgi:uncharacterized protein YuzE
MKRKAMKIEYDPTADAPYVRLGEAKTIESAQVQPGVILDFGESGKVVGVETLPVRKCGHQPLEKAA